MGNNGKRIVSAMIDDVWRRGRLDCLATYWTPDCINHADASSQNVGLDALRRYHESFGDGFRNFSDVNIELLQQVEEAPNVVTYIRTTARHDPSERRITLATMRLDRIVDDKIAEHWSVVDLTPLQSL